MRRRSTTLLLALLGCGGHREWIDDARRPSVSPMRDAIAYADPDGMVLRRADGVHRVAYGGCLGDGKLIEGVIALADGWRALAYGYTVSGGNWIESGSLRDTFACVVDFRDRGVHPIDPQLLGDLRLVDATAGTATGWVYVTEVSTLPVNVVDLAHQRAAKIDVGVHIVEHGSAITAVRPVLEQADSQHPIYRCRLEVQAIDPAAWPPTVRQVRTIQVAGRTDDVALSADGRFAAYQGSPYYEEREVKGPVYDLGLVDLETGRVLFESLHVPGQARLHEVLVSGGRPWLLVSTQSGGFSPGPWRVAWFDDRGAQAGESAAYDSYRMVWVDWLGRPVSLSMSSIDRVDLPLPGSGTAR